MTAAVLERPGSVFDDAASPARPDKPVGTDTPTSADTPANADTPTRADTPGHPAAAAPPFGRGRLTLEERLDAVLHATRTNGSAECPVCDSRMTSTRAGASTRADAGAECGGCGTRLS